jgi:uncharacterized membrane protein
LIATLAAVCRAGLLFAAASASAIPAAAAGEVTDADALAIVRQHCVPCHAHKPSHPSFDAPPKNVALETIDELKVWAAKILEQVVLDRNMPVGGDTGMTEDERQALGRWVEQLK